MKNKRILVLGAGALLLLMLFWARFHFWSDPASVSIMAPVKKGPLIISVSTSGELQALNSEEIKGPITMQAAGIYNAKISYLIPEGTVVKEGDLIAELDKSDVLGKLKDGAADLNKIESEYLQTKLDTALDMRKLRDELVNQKFDMEEKKLQMEQSKFEPPAVIRQAEIDMQKAERAYKQSETNYKLKLQQNQAKMGSVTATLNKQQGKMQQLQELLQAFTVKAPKAGMLIYKKDWGGRKIKTGSQINSWDPVVATLPDLSVMVSQTYVNEIDISKLKMGQNVEIGVDAFPGRKFSGKIITIANVGEQLPNIQTKVFEVNISINEKDTVLRPAMTTSNVVITQTLPANTLYIPLDCIQGSDTFNYVYVSAHGKTVKQEVIIGATNAENAEIKEGLKEGDMVYLSSPADAEKASTARLPKELKDKYRKTPARPIKQPVQTNASAGSTIINVSSITVDSKK